MATQITYGQTMGALGAGKRPDSSDYDSITRAAAEAIEFGKVVIEDATGTTVSKPSTSTDKITGVAMHYNKMKNSGGVAQYEIGEPVSVQTEGKVIMLTETAVTDVNAIPFVRYVDGGTEITGKGVLRGSTGTAEAFSATGKLKYRSLAAAGGLVEVEILRP